MRYLKIVILLIAILNYSCKQEKKENVSKTKIESEPKMLVTHYYSVKMENGVAVRNNVKNCLSCNQAEVYDRDGKQTELRFYKSNMKDMFGYEVFDYNESGHKTGSKYFEADSLITISKYETDKNGRILKGLAYNANTNELFYGYINAYDENGNLISTGILNSKEEISSYYKKIFNEKGIVIQENIEDLEGNSAYNIKYEYRPEANEEWTEQLTYHNDELTEIRFREELPLKKK